LKGGKMQYNKEKKTTAKKLAYKMRKKGLNASVYKKKKGYGVSVTRK
jgi:hypothetical protein